MSKRGRWRLQVSLSIPLDISYVCLHSHQDWVAPWMVSMPSLSLHLSAFYILQPTCHDIWWALISLKTSQWLLTSFRIKSVLWSMTLEIFVLPFLSICVPLSKFLYLSRAQLLHLWNGNNNVIHLPRREGNTCAFVSAISPDWNALSMTSLQKMLTHPSTLC